MRQSGGQQCDYAEYRPFFESESKDGGYVLVSWPKGPEQQLDGFASVEAARSWIEEDGPNWIAGSPYSH